MEITPELVQRALNALVVVVLMDRGHNLLKKGGRRRDVYAAPILDHVVHHVPRRRACTSTNIILQGDEGCVGELDLPEARDKIEAGHWKGQYSCSF